MRAHFLRPPHERDQIHALRADGSSVSWTCPTYGGALPHDLVHWVVEAAFELRRGLWGLVAAGSDPSKPHELGRDGGVELLQAEAACTTHWYDPDLGGEARCEAIRAACAEWRVAPPPTLHPDLVEEICLVMRGLRAKWRTVHHLATGARSLSTGDGGAHGQSLMIDFDPWDPRATFSALRLRNID